MTDHAALPEPAEPREVPPGPDKLLSLACALWLLNALTGAAVAIREDLLGRAIAVLKITAPATSTSTGW